MSGRREPCIGYRVRGWGLWGGEAIATVTGSAGRDFIHRLGDGKVVPAGFVDVTGVTTAADEIGGLGGDDIMYGDAGNDVIDGGAGADGMTGGTGDDTYYVDSAGDTVIEANGEGIDQVFSTVSFSLVGQYVEKLTLTGGGNTNGTGNSLANTLTGNSGSNVLNGRTGADVMTGARATTPIMSTTPAIKQSRRTVGGAIGSSARSATAWRVSMSRS